MLLKNNNKMYQFTKHQTPGFHQHAICNVQDLAASLLPASA
jgi:hypothetical protein